MLFPLCLLVVEIQGAHKLVGLFDLYSQVERPCMSCDCTFDNLDNFQVQCNAIIHDDMRNAIINRSKDKLKECSKHKLPENAFFKVSKANGIMVYGDHILQRYCISYMKVESNMLWMFTDASRDKWEKDVAKIFKCYKIH